MIHDITDQFDFPQTSGHVDLRTLGPGYCGLVFKYLQSLWRDELPTIHNPPSNDNNPALQFEEPVPDHNPQPPHIQSEDNSAVSAEDKTLLNNCRVRLMAISMESCELCHEE